MIDENIALEILIEFSDLDIFELAERKGIDIEHKSRGALIRELLNLEDITY